MASIGPFCGLVKEKCLYKNIVSKLAQDQSIGLPGKLGPVQAFQGEKFFHQFNSLNIGVSTIINGPGNLKGYGQYLVFGDIHGDLLALLGVLRLSGVIDKQARWKPRQKGKDKRCVVQLGDLLDRGGRGYATVDTSHSPREELNLIEYLFHLDKEARKHGERVVTISGNHELYALKSAFDPVFEKSWRFTTKPTACPFPKKKIGRNKILSSKGALRYFALHRPVMSMSSTGWLFVHGDLPIDPLKEFIKSHKKLISRIRSNTKCSFAESVVCATNILWAAHVCQLGNDTMVFDLISHILPEYETKNGAKKLSSFPKAVCTCRTLASMGQNCDCDKSVESIAHALNLDWSHMGGIALGHTIQAHITTQCEGKVQLLDIGMSEAFRGSVNKDGQVALLRIKGSSLKHMYSNVIEK
jgi:hypothetical protein